MKKKIVVSAVLIAGALGVAVVARTQPPTAQPNAFPYHGHIEVGGVAANGLHDFRFSIYPNGSASTAPVWSEQQDAVPVSAGDFSVALGEGTTTAGAFADIWSLDQMFLGIEVCQRSAPAAACTLVPLSGRHRVLPVPSSTSSVPTGPVGEIMAIHFDAPDPDPAFWLESDGRAIPAGSRLGRYLASRGRPLMTSDLTDDRFLMGGTAADRGGDNDGHTHGFALQANNPPAGTPLHSHTHSETRLAYSSEQIETENQSSRRFPTGGITTATSGGPSNVNHTHPIGGSVGSGATDGDAPGSNRPRFHAVRYFVKIN